MINLLILILLFQVTVKNLIIYQNQYYDTYRLIKAKKKNIFKLYLFIIPLLIIDLIYNNYIFSIASITFLILLYTTKELKILDKKYTFRANRLIIINLVLSMLLILCINKYYVFISSLLIIFNIFLLDISNKIDSIFRLIIDKYYINKLKKKLNNIKPITIGITGSYGKTSTKNYLYTILKQKYNTLKTSGNINTFKGIITYLNKYLTNDIEILIIEIGLDKKNTIDKFFKIFNFDYSFLTGIEKCHLATFKSIENIIDEKMKLLDHSKEGFINLSNNYLKESKYYSYSLNDLEYSKYINNKIYFKLKNIDKEYITSIIGDHHLINIIGVIKFLKYLNFDDNLIFQGVLSLKNEPHRYELKNKEGLIIIDDAYNSNETGFKYALKSLKYFDKKKIIITPGIIELDKENKDINYNLGKEIIEYTDEVYLIGKNSLSIKEYFIDHNYSNYKYFNTYKEGMNEILKLNKEAVILIENDLLTYYLD